MVSRLFLSGCAHSEWNFDDLPVVFLEIILRNVHTSIYAYFFYWNTLENNIYHMLFGGILHSKANCKMGMKLLQESIKQLIYAER